MALLLAEERFLKIKQAMEEELNQPEVLQELLLKLINDLQILKGIQQEKKQPTAQSSIPYWNFSMIDDEEARDKFLKDVCTFLRKFSRIPFGVTPKVILIAWESFGKIKDALTDKQYRQEDIQELMSKLLEDVRNISEEGVFVVKLAHIAPIPPGIVEADFDPNDDTSSDDDSFENIEYVDASPSYSELDSLEEENEDQEEKEFNLEDIFQIQDINPLRIVCSSSFSPFSYPVADSDAFFEESDTSLSHLENSLPEFETFSDHTEETRSGSTTTIANYSLPELPEFESFHFDPSFPRPPPEPPDVEICLHFEPDAPVIDNFNELNDDQKGEDYPDFEDSRAHGFVHSYIRASYPQLHLGNQIS
ncbi:hypothetical protein Tco_0844714 [Tanacetum coccineum]